LAHSDVEGAKAKFTTALDAGDLTLDGLVRWANFFASEDHADFGLSVFDRAIAEGSMGAPTQLRIEQLGLAVRYGLVDKAMELEAEAAHMVQSDPDAAQALSQERLNLGQALVTRGEPGDLRTALRLADAVLASAPLSNPARRLKAQVLLAQDPPDQVGAIAILEEAVSNSPTDGTALYALAALLNQRGETERALRFADRAVAAAPENAKAIMLRADLQIAQGHYLEARTDLERLGARTSYDDAILARLVTCYRYGGQPELGIALLDRLAAEGIVSTDSPYRAELLLAAGRDLPQVEATLRSRYEATPDDASAARDVATAIAQQGRTSEAEDFLTAFAESHASDPDAWVMLADFLLAANTPESLGKASSALVRALVASPAYPPALKAMIAVRLRSNSPAQAIEVCERYLQTTPQDAPVWYEKARLLRGLGKRDQQALEAVNNAVRIREEPEYLFLRGAPLRRTVSTQQGLG
jgi:tetratricopeptide (TPR) repeat protein